MCVSHRDGKANQMSVEAYWGKSDEELYAILGAELLGDGLGISPEDQENSARFGKEWFTNKHRQLQRRICTHERVQGLLGTSTSDRFLDAVTIYELLKELGDDTVNAAVVAVLVARVGLGSYCSKMAEPS
jgi:hypothetical protein